MKKKIKSQKCILFILYIAFFTISCLTIVFIVKDFKYLSAHDNDSIKIILKVLMMVNYAFLSYVLIKIVKCDIYTIFSVENGNNFKKLGYGMIFLSIIEGILNFSTGGHFHILSYGNRSLKAPSIIFFIIGLTNIYLSYVFKEGKRIKEENDLTI
ncbi:DUF2975 domain-containing protein [Clostridium senegalense]|uniref:DUF2975 domain-containing protein n=1 Tax=Clostridium senegalense TaxID=1465809 RepID=A0A6M0H7R1_9CLOT|nr:DUF2975 domain-containing protein [Clostridium senegalense]NEU06587.1 DUF2975 domain-containing protein [Clostridium senegalense]